jgi:hypothetical protein
MHTQNYMHFTTEKTNHNENYSPTIPDVSHPEVLSSLEGRSLQRLED